jgi:hypothetical protein
MKASHIRPRNDIVLVRIRNKGVSERGVALPDISDEGKEYIVEAIGSKVEDIAVGDRVEVLGKRGVTYDFLPGSHDLFIVNQGAIPIIYKD